VLIGGVLLGLATSPSPGGVFFSSLVTFDGTNGGNPVGPLVQARDGNFYGTAPLGGTSNNGTVFVVSPGSVAFTNLYSFAGGADGVAPYAGLIQLSDGALYGSTYGGGASNAGTLFRITTNGMLFPQKGSALREAGLRRVSFSLDSLARDNFRRITGRDGLSEALQGIERRPSRFEGVGEQSGSRGS